jgi:zinc transport system permease protein
MTGVLCSALSFFVYLRRLPYAASGIAHAAFGGVAVGLYLGYAPATAATAASVVLALLIGYLSQRGSVAHESIIGIVSAAAMAGGVVALGLYRGYVPDLYGYLFGSILAVRPSDLLALGLLSAGVLGLLAALFRPLLYVAFDPESARAAGLPVAGLDYALLMMVALTVVVAVRLLGMILASALLIAPAATGYQLSRGYRGMLSMAVACGVGSVVGGLALSYRFDLASCATITLCATGLFALACVVRPSRHGGGRHGLTKLAGLLERLMLRGRAGDLGNDLRCARRLVSAGRSRAWATADPDRQRQQTATQGPPPPRMAGWRAQEPRWPAGDNVLDPEP